MPSLEDSSATQEYDETVAEFSQDLLFICSEWDRMEQKSEGVDERLMVMDKTLVMYEKRFDSLDHRFDQLTQILHRMETNQMSEKSQGKAVASQSNEQTPPLQSSSRSQPPLLPPGFQLPPTVCETREGLLKKIDMPVFDGASPFGWIARVERYFHIGNFHGLERLQLVSLSLEGHVLTGLMEKWIMTLSLIGCSLRGVWSLGSDRE